MIPFLEVRLIHSVELHAYACAAGNWTPNRAVASHLSVSASWTHLSNTNLEMMNKIGISRRASLKPHQVPVEAAITRTETRCQVRLELPSQYL